MVFTRFSGRTDSRTHSRTDRPEYSMPQWWQRNNNVQSVCRYKLIHWQHRNIWRNRSNLFVKMWEQFSCWRTLCPSLLSGFCLTAQLGASIPNPESSTSCTALQSLPVTKGTSEIIANKTVLTSSVQSCVRPFCAASWSGVKPHLSTAFTQVLYLISNDAMSTC